MNNTVNQANKSLVIVGDNFIAQSLYNNYKRYGKLKPNITQNISHIKYKTNYIIDCSFNERTQNMSLSYCRVNDVEKIILINHWERKNLPKIKTTILQSVLYDVYGIEHNSFYRQGAGNNYDSDINYCTLISESIRRIHEAKIGAIPNIYIPYGENKIRYSHIDNIYDPINYMLSSINKNDTYGIYDDEKYVNGVLLSIQKIIDYKGNVVLRNNNSIYTQKIKNLDYKKSKFNFENSIRRIYNYLIYNNDRFMIY